MSSVVAMSGSAVSHWAIDNNPRATALELAQFHGCPTTNVLTMIKCLQALPGSNIVEVRTKFNLNCDTFYFIWYFFCGNWCIQGDDELESVRIRTRGFVSGLSGLLGAAPIAEGRHDGRFLPSIVEMQPLGGLAEGKFPKIPLLTGITKDETKKACHGNFQVRKWNWRN